MKQTMNITYTEEDMGRYNSREDLQRFYKEKGLDGLELMLCYNPDLPEKVVPEEVIGIHLRYFPGWLDFWRGNTDALLEEYGNRETWEMFYGAKTPDELLNGWREELEIAHKTGVKYVVFHVAECTLGETQTYKPLHSDEEVCDAACEIINRLLDGKPYKFYFLVENLWWSGFTMTKPAVTKRLLDGIHYQNKGIMLDTGHLLHTNLDLVSQDQGVRYIHSVLDHMGDLAGWIRGIHLNQSITGDYVKSVLRQPFSLEGSYWDRLGRLYSHILRIDCHRPFTASGVPGLIERLDPAFLTLEFISTSRQQQEQQLTEQLEALHRLPTGENPPSPGGA